MASNNFKSIAIGGGANVITQVAFEALTSLFSTGFTSGLAKSDTMNKVWRQSSLFAEILGQIIVNQTDQDAIDDGTTATLLANLVTAIQQSAIGFTPHPANVPNMTVKVGAGSIQNGTTLTNVAVQTTATLVAPVTNPRIDRVVIDSTTGTVSVIAGAEAASPTAPALTAGVSPICQVLLTVGMTAITRTSITDERTVNIVPGLTQSTADARYGSAQFSVAASVAANALTVQLTAPCKLDFRNPTLTSGVPVSSSIAANLTLTVPSGSTLGTVNGVAARLVLLVAYNAGTPVLCIVNLSGGNQLDETNLISPTTISGASNSANVIYSASAVGANSPYRIVGFVDITEATAGTWATDRTEVQGIGGQALSALSSLGYGQTLQDVTGSRALATTYYNTTGKPIEVSVKVTAVNGNNYLGLTINGVTRQSFTTNNSYVPSCHINGIVPPGGSYSAAMSAGTATLSNWTETR